MRGSEKTEKERERETVCELVNTYVCDRESERERDCVCVCVRI